MKLETAIQPLHYGQPGLSSGRAEGAGRANEEPFEGIYLQHRERVYSLCLRKAGSEAKAQSLMKDAFSGLFRKLGTFRGVATFYRTYSERPQAADFIAEWICRQSDQYRLGQAEDT